VALRSQSIKSKRMTNQALHIRLSGTPFGRGLALTKWIAPAEATYQAARFESLLPQDFELAPHCPVQPHKSQTQSMKTQHLSPYAMPTSHKGVKYIIPIFFGGARIPNRFVFDEIEGDFMGLATSIPAATRRNSILSELSGAPSGLAERSN
jgi:hypothetical protein